MISMEVTRNTFETIREMGALCATPGVSIETQEKANKVIQKLIDGVLIPAATDLSAKGAGIITR